jgi:hypothetical protein
MAEPLGEVATEVLAAGLSREVLPEFGAWLPLLQALKNRSPRLLPTKTRALRDFMNLTPQVKTTSEKFMLVP